MRVVAVPQVVAEAIQEEDDNHEDAPASSTGHHVMLT